MSVLNDADAVRLGASMVDAVYVGVTLVWSAVPPVPATLATQPTATVSDTTARIAFRVSGRSA